MSDYLFDLPPSLPSGPPLTGAEAEVMTRAGCGPLAFEIVRRFQGKERRAVIDFLLHYSKRGPCVLALMGWLGTAARLRGWPHRLGSETLRGHLRFTLRGFHLHNNLAPFYVAALAIVRRELAGLLDCAAPLPQKLIRMGWKPSIKGGLSHE